MILYCTSVCCVCWIWMQGVSMTSRPANLRSLASSAPLISIWMRPRYLLTNFSLFSKFTKNAGLIPFIFSLLLVYLANQPKVDSRKGTERKMWWSTEWKISLGRAQNGKYDPVPTLIEAVAQMAVAGCHQLLDLSCVYALMPPITDPSTDINKLIWNQQHAYYTCARQCWCKQTWGHMAVPIPPLTLLNIDPQNFNIHQPRFFTHPDTWIAMWQLKVNEFGTFNEFFARKLKPVSRPIASPSDPKIVVQVRSPFSCYLLSVQLA